MVSLSLILERSCGLRMAFRITHIWREANLCADDILAKLGARSNISLTLCRNPPHELLWSLFADFIEIAFNSKALSFLKNIYIYKKYNKVM